MSPTRSAWWMGVGLMALAATGPLHAQEAPRLKVEVASGYASDGRTPVPVDVVLVGEVAADEEAPAAPPEWSRPWVECDGAATLPGIGALGPRIVPPLDAPVTCTAHLGEVIEQFQVAPGTATPGLLATFEGELRAGGAPLSISVVRRGGDGGLSPVPAAKLAVSLGEVSELGGGRFQVTLPEAKVPSVLSVAVVAGAERTALFLPLLGATRLPVETRYGRKVEVSVAGRLFAADAGKRRRVEVPIEVPPGVNEALVRALDRVGNVSDTRVELGVPPRPRLAALAAFDELSVATSTPIVVALADVHGMPAARGVVATADVGELSPPRPLGRGLFELTYQAPKAPASVVVTVSVEGSPGAGKVEIPIEVVPGRAVALEVRGPEGVLPAGEETLVTAVVRDANGNEIPAARLEARVEGAEGPLAVADGGGWRLIAPEQVPATGSLGVVVSTGEIDGRVEVPIGPGVPKTARIDADVYGRDARLAVTAADAYGNPTPVRDLRATADGGTLTPVGEPGSGRWQVVPLESVDLATVVVTDAEGSELGRTVVEFPRPPPPWRVDGLASATLGFPSGVILPRLGVGLATTRETGRWRWGGQVGLGGGYRQDRIQVPIGGVDQTVDRAVTTACTHLMARIERRLWRRGGLWAAAGPVIGWTRTRSEVTALGADDRWAGVGLGIRGELGTEVDLGPGQLWLAGRVGTMNLQRGSIRGELEGLGVVAGYRLALWRWGGRR